MTELDAEIVEAERVLARAMRMPPGPERMEALCAAGKYRNQVYEKALKADPNVLLRKKTALPD